MALYTPWVEGTVEVSQGNGGSTSHTGNLYYGLDFAGAATAEDKPYYAQGFGTVHAIYTNAKDYAFGTDWDALSASQQAESGGYRQLGNFVTMEKWGQPPFMLHLENAPSTPS